MGKYAAVYFSPKRGSADVVIGFIDRCTTTLDIAVYSITHDEIASAIIRAHQRGVAIRVLVDKTQAGGRYSDDERLLEAGVSLRRDTQSGLMHHKYAIDGSYAVATGSFNWTANADTRNAENFVILRLKYILTAYQQEFDKIWELNAPAPS